MIIAISRNSAEEWALQWGTEPAPIAFTPNPDHVGIGARWVPYGIGRRLSAGLQSLRSRAHLRVEVVSVGDAVPCSIYGDTDRYGQVSVGSPDGYGRRALVEGTIILHRTQGGRAEWGWEPTGQPHEGYQPARLRVWPSGGGEPTEAPLKHLPYEWYSGLAERVVETLAANLLEAHRSA